MLCRLAESLYWMDRHVERAKNIAGLRGAAEGGVFYGGGPR
jgi:uncharacterized alpha-E superfamily protein